MGRSDFTTTSGGGIADQKTHTSPSFGLAALQIWSTSRSTPEIQFSMVASSDQADFSTSKTLVGYWKFDDLFGSYATDCSPQKNTARLIGEPEFRLSKLPQVTAPDSPMMVEHEVLSSTSFRVMWEAPERDGGATIQGYSLEESKDFVNYEVVYQGPDLEFEVTGLSNIRFYSFRVAAINFAGMSKYSNVSYFGTTPGTPLAPRFPPQLELATTTTFEVSWARPKCNGSLLVNYTVEITDSRGSIRRLGSHVDIDSPRKTVVAGLLPGRTYSIRVRGANNLGEGAWSEPTLMQTLPSAPNAPQWGSINSTATTVTLRWHAPSNNGGQLRRFRIERSGFRERTISSLAGAPPPPLSPTQRRQRAVMHKALQHTSLMQLESSDPEQSWQQLGVTSGLSGEYTDTTVGPAIEYAYRIRSENDYGESEWTEMRVTTWAAVPGSTITITVSDITNSNAVVSWQRPVANGPPIFKFRAQIALLVDHPTWRTFYEGEKLSSTVTDVVPGAQYLIRVLALNCKGWSLPSPPYVLISKPIKPATPPSLFVRKIASHAAVFLWTPPNGHGQIELTYTLEMRSGNFPFFEVYTGTIANTTVRGLLPATDYEVRVAAASKSGISAFTNPVLFRTNPAMPNKPTTFKITDTRATTISLIWDVPATNGDPIEGFEVFCGESASEELHRMYRGNDAHVTLVGLVPTTTYRIRLRAFNTIGASEYSEIETTTYSSPPFTPFPPFILGKNKTSIQIGWMANNITTYKLKHIPVVSKWILQVFAPSKPINRSHILSELQRDSNFVTMFKGAALEYEAQNLEPNTVYYFRVQALNPFGDSPFSYPLAASTLGSNATVPDSVTNISLWSFPTQTSLQIGWADQGQDSTNAITEFVIERTQPFPWDQLVDGEVQGWLQPPWNADRRVSRLRGEAAGSLAMIEVYRGEVPVAMIPDLAPGRAYGIRARGINVLGASISTPFIVFHTVPAAPDVPTQPQLVASSATELRIEWDRPADGGSPILSYSILFDSTAIPIKGLKRFFVAKGLLPGSKHTFAVIATNVVGSVTGDVAEFFTANGSPFRPPKIIVAPAQDIFAVDIRWSQALPAGTPVTGYTLEMRGPFDNYYVPLVQNDLKFSIRVTSGLIPGREHALRLFAHSDAGVSEVSEVVLFTAPSILPPKPQLVRIQGTTATSINFAFELDWSNGPCEHELRVGANSSAMAVVSSGSHSHFVLNDLQPDTKLVAQLRYVNSKGNGTWSDEVYMSTETTCVGDDGSVCSGRGQCILGRCVCYKRYIGIRCESQLDIAMCAVHSAGHVIDVDAHSYTTRAVGEYVAFALSDAEVFYSSEPRVAVHVNFRPVEFERPNMTAIDSVAISIGNNTLTLSTSRRPTRASNNVYVRLNCGPNVGVQIRQALDSGLDLSGSPFHVRFDYAKRFVVALANMQTRVIVQPWMYNDRWFLSAYVVDSKPRLQMMRGICGSFSPKEAAPKLERILKQSVPGGWVSDLWFDQWYVSPPTNITQCIEEENPVFDTTPPVPIPNGDASPANDMVSADAAIISALEIEGTPPSGPAAVEGWCSAHVLPLARAMCSGTQSQPFVFSACVWDVCASQGSNLFLASHADARRAIAALEESIASLKDSFDEEESRASTDGSLTNGQLPLPVCPQ
eukprot:c13084_g1_i5.p1 GENE.c13084_g1_i5~~c13084_g1_i5.p1  ORF type:complete len:1752 (+),score=293.21 c13084_g1_i5:331-5256(+)